VKQKELTGTTVEAGIPAIRISKPKSQVNTSANCLTAAGTVFFKNLQGQQKRSFSFVA
jgi:hypothetical protein